MEGVRMIRRRGEEMGRVRMSGRRGGINEISKKEQEKKGKKWKE